MLFYEVFNVALSGFFKVYHAREPSFLLVLLRIESLKLFEEFARRA